MLLSLSLLKFAVLSAVWFVPVQDGSETQARVPKPAAEQQEEEIFSGPQTGESLPELNMNGVYDELAGQSIQVTKRIGNKPALLIFVHERSRPRLQ